VRIQSLGAGERPGGGKRVSGQWQVGPPGTVPICYIMSPRRNKNSLMVPEVKGKQEGSLVHTKGPCQNQERLLGQLALPLLCLCKYLLSASIPT